MTLPASGHISLQMLRNEYYGGGGPANLQHYGALVLGRANCSLMEFYGRSAEYRYSTPFNAGSSWVVFGTPWGGVQAMSFADPGFSSVSVYTDGGGAAAWPHLLRVELTSGVIVYPGNFTHAISGTDGRPFAYWNGGPLPAGDAWWVYK